MTVLRLFPRCVTYNANSFLYLPTDPIVERTVWQVYWGISPYRPRSLLVKLLGNKNTPFTACFRDYGTLLSIT